MEIEELVQLQSKLILLRDEGERKCSQYGALPIHVLHVSELRLHTCSVQIEQAMSSIYVHVRRWM